MFDVIRQKPQTALIVLGIPALIVIVYLALVVRLTLAENDGYIGALLDDTWIHIRFAESIAEGRGLMYNDGVVTPGATSPLWVLLLGGAFALTGPGLDGQVLTAVIFSAIGAVVTVLAISGFGWWAVQRAWAGLLAGLITALTGRFIWMGLSGMEITTFTALCIFALWSHVHDIREHRVFGWRTGILVALATLARPEGYLLALLIGLDAFVFVPLREGILTYSYGDFWRHIRPGWRGILSYVLLAGSYPLACLMMTGYPLPNTFRVKSQLGDAWPELPHAFFWTPNVDHGAILIVLAGLGTCFLLFRGLVHRIRIGIAWPLWPALFVLAVVFMGPDRYVVNNARYVAPAIPFHALLAAVGIYALLRIGELGRFRRIPVWLRAKALPALLAVVMIFMAGWLGRGQGAQVANDVGQLQRMHFATAEWLESVTAPGDVLALNDVGVITHFTGLPVLDLVGLVSPEVIDALADLPEGASVCARDIELARVMMVNQPRYVIVFPWFFPCLTSWPGMLQPQTVFAITGPTVIAGGELVVYTPVWEEWPLRAAVSPAAIPQDVDFERGISLVGYEVTRGDDGLDIVLWWKARGRPGEDCTVFAHLIDEAGNIISQSDSRPQNGQFNTAWWREGDIISDARFIPLASSAYQDERLRLRVGLYTTDEFVRLPRFTAPSGEEDFVLLRMD